jgi:hypothetical protein
MWNFSLKQQPDTKTLPFVVNRSNQISGAHIFEAGGWAGESGYLPSLADNNEAKIGTRIRLLQFYVRVLRRY